MQVKYCSHSFDAAQTTPSVLKSVLKINIAVLIKRFIKSNGWTQVKAARYLGVSQPRISNLMNEQIEKFTLDNLFTMLDRLGYRISFEYLDLSKSLISIERNVN